ncbi:hypothetical protein DS884_02495 [Tenacibaculum sp. E3R01]|uniref:hypothetical protein n=1 Tax=Tenacibaculum sp. E3R01 TaxID=2267227 RepID=UPI000DEB83C4|nr:hypothetical protein [Tenacibaculum sp. E3R01]RBW62489.1 hypothetical protein DS884_02495 [Tenacibaculum sp. E3R01]
MADKKVNIELTNDEAIVLFEFLARFNESDDLSRFEDQSEQRVLWNIECILEKELSEPFISNYQDIIKIARENVRDKIE